MKNEKNRVILPEKEKLFPALSESESQQDYETKKETEENTPDYTEAEMNCKGCMGPCGYCKEEEREEAEEENAPDEESELLKEVIEAKEEAEKEVKELQKDSKEQSDESMFKRLDLALYRTFYSRIENIIESWRFILEARFERQSKGLLLLNEKAWTPQTSKGVLGRAMTAWQIYTIIHKLPAEDIFKLAEYFHKEDNK